MLVLEYAPNDSVLNYLRGLRTNLGNRLDEAAMTYWWTRARTLIADLYSFAIDIASALVYLEKLAVRYLHFINKLELCFI